MRLRRLLLQIKFMAAELVRMHRVITHLLFADNNFLFFRASREESMTIKAKLNLYEKFKGQVINFQKSCIFFSANFRREKQQELSLILGVQIIFEGVTILTYPQEIERLMTDY